jgi:hypothetical protein
MLILNDRSILTPGEFRQREVQVGRHLPPKSDYLSQFLHRYAEGMAVGLNGPTEAEYPG